MKVQIRNADGHVGSTTFTNLETGEPIEHIARLQLDIDANAPFVIAQATFVMTPLDIVADLQQDPTTAKAETLAQLFYETLEVEALSKGLSEFSQPWSRLPEPYCDALISTFRQILTPRTHDQSE